MNQTKQDTASALWKCSPGVSCHRTHVTVAGRPQRGGFHSGCGILTDWWPSLSLSFLIWKEGPASPQPLVGFAFRITYDAGCATFWKEKGTCE